MGRETVHVIGYPRSGTTWIARTLAMALNSPALSYSEEADATFEDPVVEGVSRPGDYVVRRGHWSRLEVERGDVELSDKVLFVARDPRDVAISCWHHFTFSKDALGLEKCIRQLCGLEDGPPLLAFEGWGGRNAHGWPGYVEDWLDCRPVILRHLPVVLRYERMLNNPEFTLFQAMDELGLKVSQSVLRDAVGFNGFENRRKLPKSDGDYTMRTGKMGNWLTELPENLIALIQNHCGTIMRRLRYGF